jgi:hypothetical protein
LALAAIVTDADLRRRRQVEHRLLVIQARELALGLRAFPVGTELTVGRWHLRRSEAGAEATTEGGRLVLAADGSGRWESTP